MKRLRSVGITKHAVFFKIEYSLVVIND